MIYGDMILEQKFDSLIKSPTEIMEEYYENEIYFLNSVIECQNSIMENGSILESDNNYIIEGFASNIIQKIKEIIDKFIEWCKNIFKSIKNIFTKKEKDIKTTNEKVKNDLKKN